MKTFFFNLRLSYEECRPLYLGTVQNLIVRTDTGERVQLPVVNLRPFVEMQGLKGRFRLIVNEYNKIHSLERVS
ncbi:DUF2835 family protein [Bowmanella yangjiangensis]|uniref:DUF2835 family protein n=1 Tax=Bowmanella yangjiangensis TaxID=2811230 RepID=A0ABS3CTX5_9ALTE|nr:DUF2835 family protein [Bowmanella yangjiangensis]MBN7820568.1 DUF2835 family protein [Bowmanella yangjiangensis]